MSSQSYSSPTLVPLPSPESPVSATYLAESLSLSLSLSLFSLLVFTLSFFFIIFVLI